jgi:7-cyano-7-deazaguanine synthase in queuosine biosynthesis
MANPVDVWCGALHGPSDPDGSTLSLALFGDRQNVKLSIHHLCGSLVKDVPTNFHDLLEIATYVHVADQATSRGPRDGSDFGEGWRRHFRFHIPVRNPGLWNSPAVNDAMRRALAFLSDDQYEFTFVKDKNPAPLQHYIPFENHCPCGEPDEVVLFSGGLDSLAGAMDELLVQKHRVLLVSHVSTHKHERWHKTLRSMMQSKAGGEDRACFVRVQINKDGDISEEYTQRARSFLYASLAATVASMLGKKRIRFYENGVVSLNLPICDQLIGSRATRTTHPLTLRYFQELLSLVANEPFEVENRFQWKTKTEVVKHLLDLGCGPMISNSTSCAHTWRIDPKESQSHCGECSQCIDRRFATLAAGAAQLDPTGLYISDLFFDEKIDRGRNKGRTILGSFASKAQEWKRATEVEILTGEGDIGYALMAADSAHAEEMSTRIVQLVKRHADAIDQVIKQSVKDHADKVVDRCISPDSFLYMLVNRMPREDRPPEGSTRSTSERPLPIETSPNWFRPNSKGWIYRINDGEPEYLKHCVGGHLLYHLIQHRPSPFWVTELAQFLRGNFADLLKTRDLDETTFVIETFQADPGMEMLDSEAVTKYKARLQEIDRELKSCNDPAKQVELEDEQQFIRKELEKATAFLNPKKIRKAYSGLEKLRKSIRKNLADTLDKIAEERPAFAQHFRAEAGNLFWGKRPAYAPGDGRQWDLRLIDWSELDTARNAEKAMT